MVTRSVSEGPSDSREVTKTTSDVSKAESEEREQRRTAEGTFEKKTTHSEIKETRTSSSETFQAAQGRLGPREAWHEGLPPQVRVSLSGVKNSDDGSLSDFDADYVLYETERNSEQCRWELEFPSRRGLHRTCVEAAPNPDGTLQLRAFLEGRVAGPLWGNPRIADFREEVELSLDETAEVEPTTETDWPDSVSLTPLFTPAPKESPFYISPEPTFAEIAMMGSGSSSGSGPKVTFINNTRNSDRVVSAKDDTLGLPGGIKKIDVKIEPAGTTATLTIKTKAGGSGTAIFQSTGNATRTVTDTKTVTIVGRHISNGPRDVSIEAKVGNDVLGTWKFTVFRVDVTTLLTGDISTQLPATAKNYKGTTLREIFKDGDPNQTELGHHSLTATGGAINGFYGGVVFKGQIVPSGMAAGDFNTAATRSGSFNWGRTGTFRTWDKDNCIDLSTYSGEDPRETAVDGIDDDPFDLDEDGTPAADGAAGQLFVWSIDTPTTGYNASAPNGAIQRLRYNFITTISYAAVKAGGDAKWYWRTSTKTNAAVPKYQQLTDIAGDNKIAVGETPLTWNLMTATTPAFTLTDWTPLTKKKSANGNIKLQFFKVTGTGLKPAGITCKPVVVISRTDNFGTYSVLSAYRSLAFINTHTNTSIEGIISANNETFTSPDDPNITHAKPMLGSYTIDVYIGDKHVRHTKTFTVLPNQ